MRRNRRIRSITPRGVAPWSSQWQVLLWGAGAVSHGNGAEFEDEAAMCSGWRQCRDSLLRECNPGERPYAYWRFDLGVPEGDIPNRLNEHISALLDRGLIDPEEALRIESGHKELSPDQAADIGQTFEDTKDIRAVKLGTYVLKHTAQRFELAARWHSWRGRPETSEHFRVRAETIRRTLAATKENRRSK